MQKKLSMIFSANDGSFCYWPKGSKLLPLPLNDQLLLLRHAHHQHPGIQITSSSFCVIILINVTLIVYWLMTLWKFHFRESWCSKRRWSAIPWMWLFGSLATMQPLQWVRYSSSLTTCPSGHNHDLLSCRRTWRGWTRGWRTTSPSTTQTCWTNSRQTTTTRSSLSLGLLTGNLKSSIH